MPRWRSWSRILCLAGGLSAAGCADRGSYQLQWTFTSKPKKRPMRMAPIKVPVPLL